jgi:broad specificity phosphatase PhoE
MEKQSKEILSIIESEIKKGNSDIESFASSLISKIKKIITKEKLIELVDSNLSEKNIYFIRHPESEHNVLEAKYSLFEFEKWNIHDPKLTQKGIEQANNIKKKINEKKVHFDTVFVSPLSRTIQTYFLIEKDINNDSKIIVTDFVREGLSSHLDKNKGKILSQLKEENKNTKLDFEYMTKEYWWFDLGEKKDDESEGSQRFSLRLRLFILWLSFRPDKNILIISHSHVFVNIQNSKGIYNADMVKLNDIDLLNKIISFLNKYY